MPQPSGNHFAEIEVQLNSSSHQDDFHRNLDVKMNEFQTVTQDSVSRLQMETDREIQSIFDDFSVRIQDAEHLAQEKCADFEQFLTDRSNY